MSDAKVRFKLLEVGDRDAEPGKEEVFSFNCPMHDRRCGNLIIAGKTGQPRDPQGKNGGSAQWDWDGNRDAPTFSPSVNCGRCWHGYIERGRCVTVAKTDEPEVARTRT